MLFCQFARWWAPKRYNSCSKSALCPLFRDIQYRRCYAATSLTCGAQRSRACIATFVHIRTLRRPSTPKVKSPICPCLGPQVPRRLIPTDLPFRYRRYGTLTLATSYFQQRDCLGSHFGCAAQPLPEPLSHMQRLTNTKGHAQPLMYTKSTSEMVTLTNSVHNKLQSTDFGLLRFAFATNQTYPFLDTKKLHPMSEFVSQRKEASWNENQTQIDEQAPHKAVRDREMFQRSTEL